MPSNRDRSLLGERLLALVNDDWQDIEEFMEKAIPLVPPGRALRVWRTNRDRMDAEREQRELAGKKLIARKPLPSLAEQQRMGARAVVNSLLGDARDNKWIEFQYGDSRHDRKVRKSYEREFAHHCCLHGGSCKGQAPTEPGVTETPVTPVEDPDDDEALATLVHRVLESRRARQDAQMVPCLECGRPCRGAGGLSAHRRDKHPEQTPVREVTPGEIDRLLRECG